VKYVGTCNELNAAYAADGYARLKGVGALVTTYVVGELSALNGVAGSFAEKVPVVAITGTPARAAFQGNWLLHHTIGEYKAPSKMFKRVTAAHTILVDPERVPSDIDKVLRTCLLKQLPVYIGLPR
jgi:indolepyruvate decarboxylase